MEPNLLPEIYYTHAVLLLVSSNCVGILVGLIDRLWHISGAVMEDAEYVERDDELEWNILISVKVLINRLWATKITTQLDHTSSSRAFV
jgi:hypothetical protein